MRLLIVLILLTSVKAYSQVTPLNGTWVAVNCEPIGKEFIRIMNGLILSFDNDSVKVTTIFSATETVASFKLKGKKLLVAGQKFGNVVKINRDSLVLILKKNNQITFRRIEQSLNDTTSFNLTANNWYLSYPTEGREFKRRITFYDSAARLRGWRVCFVQTPGQKFKKQAVGEWILKEIGTEIVITVQQGFAGPINFYQVEKVSIDKLELKNLSDTDNTVLLLEKSYSTRNKEVLFGHVTSKTWKTKSVLSYATQSDEPIHVTDSTVYLPSRITYGDSASVELKELLENQLRLKFNRENTFEIMIGERIIQTGIWDFSADCKYIVLDSGLKREDFIELIETDSMSLTIGKQDKLKIGIGKGSTDFYYKLRLD